MSVKTTPHQKYIKHLFDTALNCNEPIQERADAMDTLREELLKLSKKSKQDMLTAIHAIGTYNLWYYSGDNEHNVDEYELVILASKVERDMIAHQIKEAQNVKNDICFRADMAFKAVMGLEHTESKLRKSWSFLVGRSGIAEMKKMFTFEAMSFSVTGDLKTAMKLSYDLNIKAAQYTFSELKKNIDKSVHEADHNIFKHLLQAGFDDVSSRSIKKDVGSAFDAKSEALEPGLSFSDFLEQMSTMAESRGEYSNIMWGYYPNQSVGDFGDGDIVSPSKEMRRFAATR